MDESSETSSAKDVPTGSLHTSLLELRRLTQNLLDGNESTVRNNLDQDCQSGFMVYLKMCYVLKGLETQR